jgi:hypothetical protein
MKYLHSSLDNKTGRVNSEHEHVIYHKFLEFFNGIYQFLI